MVTIDTWRAEIQQQLLRFVRRPRQEAALFGTESLFLMLATRVLEPFFEAFTQEPMQAVTELSRLTQLGGSRFLIHNAVSLRYQHQLLWLGLRRSAELRATVEQLLLRMSVVAFLLNELGDVHGDWFRLTLRDELEQYRAAGELVELRQLLNDPPWQSRYAAIQLLASRKGEYSVAAWQELTEALDDRSAHVRAAAVRLVSTRPQPLEPAVRERVFALALHDRDLGTRYAAARAIGRLRSQLADAAAREQLVTALFSDDAFVRSAACFVLAQIGPDLADETTLDALLLVLDDPDAYVREAAANAVAALGAQAATPAIIACLQERVLDQDQYVHDAALSALRQFRDA